jgi:hypothetical protein
MNYLKIINKPRAAAHNPYLAKPEQSTTSTQSFFENSTFLLS